LTLGVFTDDYYPHIGGIGRYVYEITKRLPCQKVLIFSPCDNDIVNHIKIKTALHNKLRNMSFSWWLHQNVNGLIKKYSLSKINIQCGPGGLFLLKNVDVPVIASCHHTWWQQANYIKSQFWKRVFIPLERLTYEKVDKIICASRDSKSILAKKYGILSEKILIIPNGTDTKKFYTITNLGKIPNSLLYVGRIDKRKGLNFLLKSLQVVSKEIPDIQLFVVGTGKQLKRLKRFVKKQNLKKNIEFLGMISDEDLNRWYNKVQCVVVPSVFEGFGLTAVEAMSCGTPVIATDVDALRDVIEDGVNGLLVKYNDVEALSGKILYLLKNKTEQLKLSITGKKKVQDIYNWSIISRDIFRVYFR